jgi:hypothetical protein
MVVQIVNVEYVTVGETESYSPVCPDRYGPEPFPLALKRMQLDARQIQIGGGMGRIEPHKNVTQLHGVFNDHSARVSPLVKALQTFVAERSDHFVP